MDLIFSIVFVGIGATIITDLWSILRKQIFGIALPNYGLVGRWIAHMRRGRFYHESIAQSAAVRGESVIGWVAHYLIGIGFAVLLVMIWGHEWVKHPTIIPAITIGIGTVMAPFLLMQPGMGAGIAASRTPKPWAARLQSLLLHFFFGLGLYISASILVLFFFHQAN